MQTRVWGLFATTLACACSGPKLELGVVDGQGGAPTGGGRSGLVPADWSRLTLESRGGFFVQLSQQSGDCEPSDHRNISEVDATTPALHWDYCAVPRGKPVERHGESALSSEQMQEVRNAVAGLGPGRIDACGTDKDLILLDVSSSAGTLTLQDDFYGCRPSADRTPVSNIDPLARLIWGWVREASQPSLLELTVVSSGGLVQAEAPGSECAYSEYPNTYGVIIATRELNWDLCRINVLSSVASLHQGRRILTEGELARLTSVYESVMVAPPECVADEPRTTLAAETSETTFRYVGKANGCGPLLGDLPFGTNVSQLRFEFSELVPAP